MSERDDIRVGDVICKAAIFFDTWNRGWILPDGSFTRNPLTAQSEAEREYNRRRERRRCSNVPVRTIRRRKIEAAQEARPEDLLAKIAERRGLL